MPDPIPGADGSELLVPKLARAVNARLLECRDLPFAAEAALAEQRSVCVVAQQAALKYHAATAVADQLADRADLEGRWPHWVVFLAVTGAIVFGGVLGLVGGWMAAQ